MIIHGKEVTWDNITREQLQYLLVEEGLTNSEISSLFNVTTSKVQYKRNKFNLTKAKVIFERFVRENQETFDEQNRIAKEWFSDPKNIDCLAKAITSYVFRDGPLESVHHKCKSFTDEDMKEINIYMVNHIAGLLTYALEGNWMQLRFLVDYVRPWSAGWYTAEAETDKIDTLFFMKLKQQTVYAT